MNNDDDGVSADEFNELNRHLVEPQVIRGIDAEYLQCINSGHLAGDGDAELVSLTADELDELNFLRDEAAEDDQDDWWF